MKNRWGIGIAIFYTSFVAIMIYFVVYSRSVNIDLVRDDYYQGDIEFQGKYDKLTRANKLEVDLRLRMDKQEKEAVLEFPKNMKSITGDITFYRASDKRLDFKVPIKLSEDNTQRVSMNVRAPGEWKVSVDWKGDGVEYFKEDEIYN